MRYGADIAERIIKELEKVPNIRYVCKKVGIDHSTFYRWTLRHPTFNKEVAMALHQGRSVISGAAETVIIKRVQEEDYKASTFWLTHHDPNYMQYEKGKQYGFIMERTLGILRKPVEFDGSNFETLFELYDEIEENWGDDAADGMIVSVVKLFCEGDENLIELFNIANTRRKKERAENDKRLKPFEHISTEEKDRPSLRKIFGE